MPAHISYYEDPDGTQIFLNSLEVNYYTEPEEEQALYNAMKKGKKTRLLSAEEKKQFVKSLKGIYNFSIFNYPASDLATDIKMRF